MIESDGKTTETVRVRAHMVNVFVDQKENTQRYKRGDTFELRTDLNDLQRLLDIQAVSKEGEEAADDQAVIDALDAARVAALGAAGTSAAHVRPLPDVDPDTGDAPLTAAEKRAQAKALKDAEAAAIAAGATPPTA